MEFRIGPKCRQKGKKTNKQKAIFFKSKAGKKANSKDYKMEKTNHKLQSERTRNPDDKVRETDHKNTLHGTIKT